MKRMWKPGQVADALNVSERMVRDLLTRGELPGKKIGKFWRSHPDDIADWCRIRGWPMRAEAAVESAL